MKVIYRRCAGMDVHEKSVSVCARILRGKELEIVEATFSTFTEDLEKLRDWLRRNRMERAVESTGVYWRPVWNIVERSGKLDLILLNPQPVKALPGRKTDRRGCGAHRGTGAIRSGASQLRSAARDPGTARSGAPAGSSAAGP